MCIGTVNRQCLVMNLTLSWNLFLFIYYISSTNSDHLGISLMSLGPSSGPVSFSETSSTPGHTTGQCGLTRRVARRSASLTKRRRADGPDNGWPGHTDPSFVPSARCLLVRPLVFYLWLYFHLFTKISTWIFALGVRYRANSGPTDGPGDTACDKRADGNVTSMESLSSPGTSKAVSPTRPIWDNSRAQRIQVATGYWYAVWLLTAPDHTGPHRTPGAPHRTTPDRTGPFGAFSELLMTRVLQLAPY